MTGVAQRVPRGRLALEWGLGAAVLCGLIYVAWYFREYAHLPQPFFFDTFDPLMDLYNTAFWGHQSGMYRIWYALYPPVSFVYVRATTRAACYHDDAVSARDCDPGARYALYALFLLNAFLVYRALRRRERGTALPRTLALALGLPALYGLDRGNLVIPTFTAFILYFGGLISREGRRLWLLALAINFKPYLLVAAFPRAAARHWRWGFTLAAMVAVIWAATYAIIGAGSPFDIVRSARTFTDEASADFEFAYSSFQFAHYSTSFAPLKRLAASNFPLREFVDEQIVDRLTLVASAAMYLALAGSALVYTAAAIVPKRASLPRLAALTICLALCVTESLGGYAQVFVLFLLFVERWRGRAYVVALVAAYALCVPYDYILIPISRRIYVDSWWAGHPAATEFGVGVGQIARPFVVLLLAYALAWMNGRDLVPAALSRVFPRRQVAEARAA